MSSSGPTTRGREGAPAATSVEDESRRIDAAARTLAAALRGLTAAPAAIPEPTGSPPAGVPLPPHATDPWTGPVPPHATGDPWTGPVPPHATGDPWTGPVPPHATGDPWTGALPPLFDTPAVGPALPTRTLPRHFDVAAIRRDFPILGERIHGKPLVWLDNAATTQKPRAVLDRLAQYYAREYSNVHRGAHTLAARSTDAYEAAREKVARFLGAASPGEIVFVRGTTEAVNLVASSWGGRHVGRGDEIVLSTLEHHSNIVPWQFLAERTGATIRVIPVDDRGAVRLSEYEKLLSARTKIVAITHVSNALGTVLPVREMVASAHRYGARVLVDGAQAVSHFPVDVQAIDADFYALSGHKLFAPTGVGVLYGKRALLDEMPPWQGGGNMIQSVTFEASTFAEAPARFEAGTGTLGDAVGLGAAVDYLNELGMENVARHERALLEHATDALARIAGIRLIGTAPEKAGVVSFVADGRSAEEIGKRLDRDGIAVRAGHHCAQPALARFGLTETVRPSFALYNTHEEIDLLSAAVRRAIA